MGVTKYDNIGQVFDASTIGAEVSTLVVSRPLTMTVLHHSSTPAAAYKGIDTVKQFSTYHRNSNGWKAIGYHWIIGPDGKIFAGRKMGEIGAHAGPKGNPRSVGVCMVGNFQSKDKPTAAQKRAFAALHSALRKKFYASGRSTLRFHRDFMNTDCPGKLTKDEVWTWVDAFENEKTIPEKPEIGPGTAENPALRFEGQIIGKGILVNGSTYVKVRDLEALGLNVKWTGYPNYTVDIDK